MVVLAMVFLIPLASAFEFDNVKSYDEEKKEITVTNLFGLGKEISKITLLSEINHHVIDRGEGVMQKVAEIKIKNNEEYNKALKNMEFFDVNKGRRGMNKEFEYRYRVDDGYHEIEIRSETGCEGEANRSLSSNCIKAIIGYDKQYKYKWITLEESKINELPKGNITLGIFLDVEKGEHGDWIPTLFGVRINEFAEWTEGLNDGLTHYWTVNSTTLDIGGNNQGTQLNLAFSGSPLYRAGLISDGIYVASSYVHTIGNAGLPSGTGDYSIVLWMNRTTSGTGAVIGDSGNNGYRIITTGGSSARLFWAGGDSGNIDIGIQSDGSSWELIVLNRRLGRANLYVDGVLKINISAASSTSFTNLNFGLDTTAEGDYWTGMVDEMIVYNRSVSISEINDLYNSGNGITYTTIFKNLDITYPTNTTYSDEQTIMNYTQLGHAYCWYSLDEGATNSTPVVAGINFTGLSSGGDSSTWTTYCNDTGNVLSSDTVTFFVDIGIETFLKAPANDTNTTDTTIEFEVNASTTGSVRLRNQTIYIYYSNSTLLTTNYSGLSGATSTRKFNHTFTQDGKYIWNAFTEGNSSSAYLSDWDVNRTFTIDTTNPTITITYPTTTIDFFKVNNNLRINWTVSDDTSPLDTCWLDYQSVNTTVTCNNNGTLINITNSNDKSAIFYANDTLGNEASNSFNWSYKVFWNSETFNATVYESQTQTYILNMSSTGDETVTANFSFNGTNYTTTKEGTNTQMNFTFSHDLPIGVGTFNFSWNVFYGSDIITTTAQSQTVDLLNLSICGLGGLNTPFINFTAKDEVTDLPIDFTVDIADWTYYYLGEGAIFKTYTYVNVNANISSFAFCATPNLTIQQSLEVKYSDFDGDYPLRTYQTLDAISNTTTNTVLYLLKTTDGEDITLQVVSPSGVPIEGVYVNVTRTISGNLVLLGSGSTGADGGINFFLNPDFTHTFTFVKAGYDTLITSFQPKDSTITLGAQITGNKTYDFLRGISWAIKPLDFTLENETHYIFNYSFANSGYWVVDEWGFILTNNSGFVIGSNSSTTSVGGNLNVNVTTGNNSYILMNYYWNIDGNYSNATKIWGVLDQTPKGTISGFINLLKLYTSDCVNCTADESSLFGLTLWGRTLLIFFAIFILTGTLAYTSGIYSPTAIAAFASGWITLFDIGLELLPLLPNSLEVHGVYSIISWMVVLMIGYREAMR